MINKAIIYAAQMLGDKTDKYSGKLRILSVMSVLREILRMSDNENIIVAAILYSLIEEAGVSLDEIREEFGDKIADLIVPIDPEEQWEERMEYKVKYLTEEANDMQKMVALANESVRIWELNSAFVSRKDDFWTLFDTQNTVRAGRLYLGLINGFAGLDEYKPYYEYKFKAEDMFVQKTFISRVKRFFERDHYEMMEG